MRSVRWQRLLTASCRLGTSGYRTELSTEYCVTSSYTNTPTVMSANVESWILLCTRKKEKSSQDVCRSKGRSTVGVEQNAICICVTLLLRSLNQKVCFLNSCKCIGHVNEEKLVCFEAG